MAGKTSTSNEKIKISLFKKVLSRHKRKCKDSNRIDDLFDSFGEDGCGVIDVARIRNRIRNRSETTATGDSCLQNETHGDERNEKIDETVLGGGKIIDFGEDLVVSLKTVLQGGHSCSCFEFKEFPGVCLYPKALDEELQLRLAYEAVTKYCELGSTTTIGSVDQKVECHNENDDIEKSQIGSYGSHRTNIDLLNPKAHERVNAIDNKEETMWNLWKVDQEGIIKVSQYVPQLATNANVDEPLSRLPPEKKAKRDTHKQKKANSNKNTSNYHYRRFSKLSWATMGYHYGWTERSYHPQKQSRMPDLVAKLSTLFATAKPVLGDDDDDDSFVKKFIPSASIVNYYTTKSTMGGHRDDLEDPDAMDKPIVSISLGLPGIFVLGGPIKDEYEEDVNSIHDTEPNNGEKSIAASAATPSPHPVRALVLRPGDVLIMGGASRLNYHAMARVLPHEAALEYDRRIGQRDLDDRGDSNFAGISWNDLSNRGYDEAQSSQLPGWKNTNEKDYLIEYLRHHRVNVNVRQVYPDE